MENKRFTKKEDAIILKEVKKSINNLSLGLRNAAEKLEGRSFTQVSNRYYYHIRKKNTLFFTISSDGGMKNTKIAKRRTPLKVLLNDIKRMLS